MTQTKAGLVFAVAVCVACRSAGAAQLLNNPDLEEVPNSPPGWLLIETGGTPPTSREAAKQQDFADQDGGGLGLWLEGFQGLYFGSMKEPVSAVLSQTVTGIVGESYTFSGYSRFDAEYSGGLETLDPGSPLGAIPSPTQSKFELAFLNGGGSMIGSPVSLDLRTEQFNGAGWAQHTLNGVAPTGTASVRVTASATDMVVNNLTGASASAFYDTFSLRRASSPAAEILANPNLTNAPPNIAAGWDTSGPHSYEGFSAHSGGTGFFLQAYQGFPEPLDATLLQTVAATAGTTYRFTGWSLFYAGYSGGVETLAPGSPYGEVPSLTDTLFVMESLSSSGTQLGAQTLDLRTVQMNDTTWRKHAVTGTAPAGTTQVRVGVRVDDVMTNVDIPFQTANFDDFSLIAVTAGDFDFDGDVDGGDFLVWQRGGSPTPNSAADLATWKAAFGTGGAVAAAGAVPEPAGLVAILCGIACWLPRRVRKTT